MLTLQDVAGLVVVEGGLSALRPTNQFEIAGDVFLVAIDAVRVPLRSVNGARVIAALFRDAFPDLDVA